MAGYSTKPILCLDFDGVIHTYISGWKGVDIVPDPPVPGAFEWIEKAMQHFEIHIYSSRSSDTLGRVAIAEYIKEHVPLHIANQLIIGWQKPRAFLTIDDRCVRFDGNWSSPELNPEVLLRFKPWNKP